MLLLFRTALGIGMGAEWPAGAALAMETWPQRSRGFMGSVLQGSWGLGALLSSAAYRLPATGFCYHQGAIFGGLVGPVLAYFATEWHMGFAIPMMIGKQPQVRPLHPVQAAVRTA